MNLRYVELPPNRIFNKLSPDNQPAWSKLHEYFNQSWWTPKVLEIRKRFGEIWVEEFDKLTKHFILQEE